MVISIDNCYNIIYNYVSLRTISNKLMIMIQEIYSNMIFNNKNIKRITAAAIGTILMAQYIPTAEASGAVITNDMYVYEFLTGQLQLNHAAASGLMANVDQECAFIPTASWTDINGKTSYGLMQWNGPRFEQLKNFCSAGGYAYDTLEGQLAFLEYELTGPYSGYYDYLLNGIENSEQGAYDAAYFWAEQYEVCRRKYFEPRAELARDYYYPAYLEYSSVPAAVTDDSFYAVLAGADSCLVLSEKDGSLQMAEPSENACDIWFFENNGNDTYRVTNCETSAELSPDGKSRMWSFYETANGFMLKEDGSQEVLGIFDDNKLCMQIGGGSENQSFLLLRKQPADMPEDFSAVSSPAPSVTKFSWKAANGADSYNLKIYSGIKTEGEPYTAIENIKETACELSLPAGMYTAVAESVNECGDIAGKPYSFEIKKQKPCDLGESFYGKISWNGKLQYITKTDESEVCSSPATFEEDQLWRFVKNNDGSYRIYSVSDESTLGFNEENNVCADEAFQSDFMIYGNESEGYVIEEKDRGIFLSAAEMAKFCGRNFENSMLQTFAVEKYDFKAPELSADVSGGEKEPVIFSWEKADCAEGYVLSVKDEEGRASASVKIRGNTGQADISLAEGKYTAEISASSSVTGENAESEKLEFYVKDLPERPSTGIGINTDPGMLSFYWNECQGADSYSYEIRNEQTGETAAKKEDIHELAGKEKLDAGKYIITVTAKNKNGTISSHDVCAELNEINGSVCISMKSVLASKKQYVQE